MNVNKTFCEAIGIHSVPFGCHQQNASGVHQRVEVQRCRQGRTNESLAAQSGRTATAMRGAKPDSWREMPVRTSQGTGLRSKRGERDSPQPYHHLLHQIPREHSIMAVGFPDIERERVQDKSTWGPIPTFTVNMRRRKQCGWKWV